MSNRLIDEFRHFRHLWIAFNLVVTSKFTASKTIWRKTYFCNFFLRCSSSSSGLVKWRLRPLWFTYLAAMKWKFYNIILFIRDSNQYNVIYSICSALRGLVMFMYYSLSDGIINFTQIPVHFNMQTKPEKFPHRKYLLLNVSWLQTSWHFCPCLDYRVEMSK